jgi:hypothetical protein
VRIEMRLVNGLNPDTQERLVVAHIRHDFVVARRDPTDAEQMTHQMIARVDVLRQSFARDRPGYWTLPTRRRLRSQWHHRQRFSDAALEPLVRLQSSGT